MDLCNTDLDSKHDKPTYFERDELCDIDGLLTLEWLTYKRQELDRMKFMNQLKQQLYCEDDCVLLEKLMLKQ